MGVLSVQHCNFLQAIFYQKRITAPKVLSNFGILYQKFTLGCSLEYSPNLETKTRL